MSPVFSILAGLKLTNGTLPKSEGPRDSTYIGYSLIYVLIAVVWQKKMGFLVAVLNNFAHTLCGLAENCTSLEYFLHVKRIVHFVLFPLL